MKTFKLSYLIFFAGFLAVLFLVSSCSDSSTGPDFDDSTQIDDPTDDDDPGDPIDPPPSDNFKIDSDDVTETDDGFRFDGNLIGINEEGIEFKIGNGEFNVVLNDDGVIISISGVGVPEFPDVGGLADLLEEFAWNRIEAHIEYKRGSEYLNDRETDIPLNPDRYYIHYRVFDESRDGKFELRRRANDFIYDFFDLYIDVDDPAVFFKVQVPIPGDGNKAEDAVNSFWKTVAKTALEKGITIGENLFEVNSSTYMVVGFSHQGTFTTPEHKLADFGLLDPALFSEFNHFDNLPAQPSNIYLKFANFPIPKTLQLLNITGDMSAYSENGNKIVLVDLLANRENYSRIESYTGDLSLSAPGLGLILEGILPAINKHTGRDLFSEDVDLAPIKGFLQYQMAIPGINPAFLRFGGSFGNPVLADIFGENIQQYLISRPTGNQFGYFNIGPEKDDRSFYVETSMDLLVPGYGQVDLSNTVVSITNEGIHLYRKDGLEIGPFTATRELEGSIYDENYKFRTEVINDFTLPNGVVLRNRELELAVSSDSGATVRGQVILPFSIGEAAATGELTEEGLTMSGMLSAGSRLALDTGLNLPTRDFEMTVSTDPARTLELHGDTQMPFIGYNRMTGIINQDHFLFDGEIDRTLSFGDLSVPVSNGKLTIDSQAGLFLAGNFQLPHLGSAEMSGEITDEQIMLKGDVNRNLVFSGTSLEMTNGDILLNNDGAWLSGTLNLPSGLRTADVDGSITENGMNLTGNMRGSIPFAGRDLTVSNSSITASTGSGVKANFDLRIISGLTVNMNGTISSNGFSFSGSRSVTRSINWELPWPVGTVSADLRIRTNTTFTQNGMNMTATGTASYDGTTLWSGTLNLSPNWSSGRIEVCIPGTSICRNI